MQKRSDPRLLGADRRGWRILLLCGLVVTWWPVSARAGDEEWLWQNPRPVGSSCGDWGAGDVSFLDSEMGMAVGCGSTILRTDDGGDTWADAGGNLEGDSLHSFERVSVIDADTAIAVGGLTLVSGKLPIIDDFIARTDDGGSTWVEQTTDLEFANNTLNDVFFSDSASGVAVGTAYFSEEPNDIGHPIIIHTADGGSTWTQAADIAAPPYIGLNGLTCTDSSTCLAVGFGLDNLEVGPGGLLVLQTVDGGDLWETRLYDTSNVQEFFDVSCPDPEICIAVGSGGEIFKSSDGGANWTERDSGTGLSLNSISCRENMTCLVVGGDYDGVDYTRTILRTSDGGETWVTELVEESESYSFTGVAFHGNTENATVTSAVRAQFLRTTDGGISWKGHPQAHDFVEARGLRGVAFATPTIGVAVGARGVSDESPGVVFQTIDGGNTWVNLASDLPGQPLPAFADVVFPEPEVAVAVGGSLADGAVILRSTDGGASWLSVTEDIPAEYGGYALAAAHFTDGDTGAVVGGQPFGSAMDRCANPSGSVLILRTLDGGTTWIDATPDDVTGFLTDVFFGDPDTGTAVGCGGTILRSVDGGATWTEQMSGASADLRAIAFADENNGWAVGKNIVLRTIDGGVTWSSAAPSVLPDEFDLTDVHFVNSADGIIVGDLKPQVPEGVNTRYGVVLTTTDGGLTWQMEEGKATRIEKPYGVAAVDSAHWAVVGDVRGTGGSSFILQKRVDATFLPLGLSPSTMAMCVPDGPSEETPIYVDVGSVGGYIGEVQLATAGEPTGVSSVLEPSSVDAPGSSTWTLTVDSSVTPGQHVIALTGDDGSEQHFANFILNVVGSQQAPVPFGPANGEMDVDLRPTFTWDAIPGVGQYRIQVATDSAFDDIIVDEEVAGVYFTPAAELDSLTQYFWRVQGVYECLDDVWSEVFSFTTETQPQVQVNPSALAFEVPLGSGDDSTVEIANIGTGDLVWSIDVELLLADGCAEAQWLSVSPDAGSTPADGSTPVTVTVDTTGLEVCDYTARLHIATNDTDHASVTVPVSLTVTGSELEFDPESVDFGEVEAGHAGPPAIVTLHSVGALDATGLEFQLPGAEFDVDASACGATLPIGGQCEIIVVFTPPGVGPFSGTLEVHSDDGAIAFVSMSGQGVSETGIFVPVGLEVDTEPIISDANSVFEPGELAPVAPIWLNDGLFAQFLEGTASDLTGPEGPTYTLLAADADYGEVEAGEMASCQESGLCYEMDIGPTGVTRPAPHWDATFDEALSEETTHTWTLHLGDSFVDVPRSNLFYRPVETLLHSGITGGCSDIEYCPTGSNTRSQMAVFLLRAVEEGDYTPPACEADDEEFFDVSADSVFCPWIEELAARGVTSGCGGGNYCPNASVTRAQMAVFLLKALEGEDYTPPACTEAFSDVPCPSLFADWIEDLAARGITSGCSASEYCPSTPVTRAQMASFVTKTFGLALYGP